MVRRQPELTRTATLFPDTTLFRALASPLARDDRADGIKEFAPRRHQIRAQIDEPRLIGGMTVEPRGGQAPAQFGAAAPRAAARTGRIDEDAGSPAPPVGKHRRFLAGIEQDRKSTRLNSSH